MPPGLECPHSLHTTQLTPIRTNRQLYDLNDARVAARVVPELIR